MDGDRIEGIEMYIYVTYNFLSEANSDGFRAGFSVTYPYVSAIGSINL